MPARPPPSARAAVLTGSRTVEQRDVAVERVPPAGGWLRVDACGTCGTDWQWYAHRAIPAPMVLGHEIVGTVSELWGSLSGRDDLGVGDRLVLEEAVPCRRCELCRTGRQRMCRTSGRYGATPLDRPPALWGGYAEFVFLSPAAAVHRVPAGLDPVLAALFIPVSNGLSWLADAARLQAGESVLVIGPGQHGLATVAAARRIGAGAIYVVGAAGDERRLAAASALGAEVLDGAALAATALERTCGRGIDVVVDTTPRWTGALPVAVEVAAVSGRILVVGAKAGRRSELDTDTVFRKELTVRGVAARESAAIDAALAWLAAEPATFDPFGGLTVDLDHVEDALLALGGEAGGDRPLHAVVVPGGGRR